MIPGREYGLFDLRDNKQIGQHSSYGDALDHIRSLWLPDHCYDNPVTFRFKDVSEGITQVSHISGRTFEIRRLK